MIYSNEDAITSTPQILAESGSSAQISWLYQVEVDQNGQAVPGTAAVQGQDGSTVPFTGSYQGTHPVIQTCNLTNNVCGKTDGAMRFALPATASVDPANQPLQQVMADNPWTYWMAAQELLREGKANADVLADPSLNPTQVAGDPRSYLYLVLRKSTVGTPNSPTAWIGVTVGVKLANDPTVYDSDLGVPNWSVPQDGPVSVAVVLPPGTVADDIQQIRVTRVVGAGRDTRATVQVQSIERAFFLDANYLPESSFLFAPSQATLTSRAPSAILSDKQLGQIIEPSPTASASAGASATDSADATSSDGLTLPSMSVALPGGGSTATATAVATATARATTAPTAQPTTTTTP
jgi:hypothetical protein